jgi:hypothetical protein
VGERFRPRILKTFDLVAQEQLPASPATIHTQESIQKLKLLKID